MNIKNLYNKNCNPKRVVVLGSNGFISSAVIRRLSSLGIETLNISRKTHDLENPNSVEKLIKLINSDDILLFVAANAPVKNNEMLRSNLLICNNICDLLQKKSVDHLIYVSSDAVYKDSDKDLNEDSCAEPSSLHGIMHLARETMLKNSYNGPICILRPTLIYGNGDPHNGYGPNRFYRNAINNEEINIFGKGEERRDHINIDDVAEIICFSILRKSIGLLNIASGQILSFVDIAKHIIHTTKSKSNINYLPRVGVMPHNGFRPFDVSLINKNFPEINVKEILKGIDIMHENNLKIDNN